MKLPDLYEEEHSENIFLDTLIDKKQIVDIFLFGGTNLKGYIVGYDDFSILIKNEKEKEEQLIYKHAISTIQIEGIKEKEKGYYKRY